MRYRYFFSPQVGVNSFILASLAAPLGKSPVTWLRLVPRMCEVALWRTTPVSTLMPAPLGVVTGAAGAGVAPGAVGAVGVLGAGAAVGLPPRTSTSNSMTFLPALSKVNRT
ncbi:hypothetical protein D3C72_361970 [compost metagenome]